MPRQFKTCGSIAAVLAFTALLAGAFPFPWGFWKETQVANTNVCGTTDDLVFWIRGDNVTVDGSGRVIGMTDLAGVTSPTNYLWATNVSGVTSQYPTTNGPLFNSKPTVAFDGVANTLTIQETPSATYFLGTVCFWIKRIEDANVSVLVASGGGSDEHSIRLEEFGTPDEIGHSIRTVENRTFGYSLPTNTFYHVTFTSTGPSVTLYINGASNTTITVAGSGYTALPMVVLGITQDGEAGTFDLAELKMYSRVLTPTEITNLFLCGY